MRKLNGIVIKVGGLLASCALALGIASSQAACIMIFHQPRVPQGMRKILRERDGKKHIDSDIKE